jgi:hypothetical protein
MSYEDDIRAELSNSWIMRSRRKWLEKELARVTAQAPARIEVDRPQVAEAPQQATAEQAPSGGSIAIEGSPEFVRATEAALRKLQGTPSWVLATKLRAIKQVSSEHINDERIGGYIQDGIFHVGDKIWRRCATAYASAIAHEGAHAVDSRNVDQTDRECFAFQAQLKALKEMGASRALIDECAAHAANPTHHIGWVPPRKVA